MGRVLLVALLAGCAGPPPAPLPEVAVTSDADVLRVLRARTGSVRSAYARLEIELEGEERGGVVDAVVRWRDGGWLRATAFKDLVVSTRYVFDLLFTPDRYAVESRTEDDAPPERREGTIDSLREVDDAPFAGFHWVGEGLFLAGSLPPPDEGPPPRVERGEDVVRVWTRLDSGAPVEWRLDPATLAVRKARVTAGERELRLTYAAYREAAPGVWVPERVTYADPQGMTMTLRLEELELDADLDPATFDPGAVGGF